MTKKRALEIKELVNRCSWQISREDVTLLWKVYTEEINTQRYKGYSAPICTCDRGGWKTIISETGQYADSVLAKVK